MSKKMFSIPFILNSENDDLLRDPTVTGGLTGQGELNIVPPIGFDSWKDSEYADAFRGDAGEVSFDDYCDWWNSMMEKDPSAYSSSMWSQLNPGKLWEN